MPRADAAAGARRSALDRSRRGRVGRRRVADRGLVVAALVSVPGASRACAAEWSRTRPTLKHSPARGRRRLLAPQGPCIPRSPGRWPRASAAAGSTGVPADVGIATTGVAGPTPQDGKPVGTVHIAVATPRARASSRSRSRERERRSGPRRRAARWRSRSKQCSEIGRAAGTDRVSCRLHSAIPTHSPAHGIRLASSGVVLLSTRIRRNQK